jgi:hypothetical protein
MSSFETNSNNVISSLIYFGFLFHLLLLIDVAVHLELARAVGPCRVELQAGQMWIKSGATMSSNTSTTPCSRFRGV